MTHICRAKQQPNHFVNPSEREGAEDDRARVEGPLQNLERPASRHPEQGKPPAAVILSKGNPRQAVILSEGERPSRRIYVFVRERSRPLADRASMWHTRLVHRWERRASAQRLTNKTQFCHPERAQPRRCRGSASRGTPTNLEPPEKCHLSEGEPSVSSHPERGQTPASCHPERGRMPESKDLCFCDRTRMGTRALASAQPRLCSSRSERQNVAPGASRGLVHHKKEPASAGERIAAKHLCIFSRSYGAPRRAVSGFSTGTASIYSHDLGGTYGL